MLQSRYPILCLWSAPALVFCMSVSQISLLNPMELKILINQDANHYDMMWYVSPDKDME